MPDFLGYESGFAMAVDHPQRVEAGFRLKSLGTRITEVVGGRAVHPINVAIGGFHARPNEAAVRDLVADVTEKGPYRGRSAGVCPPGTPPGTPPR